MEEKSFPCSYVSPASSTGFICRFLFPSKNFIQPVYVFPPLSLLGGAGPDIAIEMRKIAVIRYLKKESSLLIFSEAI